MGDTAIMWAIGIARICYETNCFSPRQEIMRSLLVEHAFYILKNHYDDAMKFEDFKELVFHEVDKFYPTIPVEEMFKES